MKRESIVVGVAGLLVGVLITGFAAGRAVNDNNTGMMRMMGMDTHKTQAQTNASYATMSMTDMTQQLTDKTGDDFDKAFVAMMISHHEGAVAMAQLIPSRAKHGEVKQLGQDIIAAQTKEIAAMKQWQKDWGYSTDQTMPMMHHNGY